MSGPGLNGTGRKHVAVGGLAALTIVSGDDGRVGLAQTSGSDAGVVLGSRHILQCGLAAAAAVAAAAAEDVRAPAGYIRALSGEATVGYCDETGSYDTLLD